jgi:Tol biopolymer transport system component
MNPSTTEKLIKIVVLSGVTAALFALPSPATAAFPGQNGRIAFDRMRHGDQKIFSIKPTGRDARRLTSGQQFDEYPAYSPNGKRIVFNRFVDGDDEIFLMRANGTHLKQVTTNHANELDPSFSPSGRRIVFMSDGGSHQQQPPYGLFTIRRNGSHRHLVIRSGSQPVFSPTGGRIAFVGLGGAGATTSNTNIFTISARGHHKRQVTDSAVNDGEPSYSPDGKRIAYYRPVNGRFQIFSIRTGGRKDHQLTHRRSYARDPEYSPEGTSLIFNSGGDLFRMHADRSHLRRLTHSRALDSKPTWQPRKR